MKKAPIPADELKRLSILQQYQILDTPDEKIFDEITNLASKICEAPISLISFVDAHRQWFKSQYGLEGKETPRDVSFCGHVILDDAFFEVPNALEDERFADNPLVTGHPLVVFYAAAPLITSSGQKIGTLCVVDHKPKKLSETQIEIITSLAKQVVNILELKLRDRQLSSTLEIIHTQKNWITSVVNASRCSIIATDPSGNITTFNKGAENLLGYRESEMLGRSPAMIHDTDEIIARAQALTDELGWVVEPGFEVFVAKSIIHGSDTLEWTYVRRDGSRFYVELCVTCVKDGDKIIGFLGIANDLTEKKRAEAEKIKLGIELDLQRRRTMHNAKLASIGQLAAGVGHEINNPLGIIKGHLEITETLLKEVDFKNEKVFSNFRRIYSAIERIAHITTGLRVYSRIDDNQIKPFNVNKLIVETVEMLSGIYDKEGVTLFFDEPKDDVFIKGNSGRFQQAILNLISNAKDATEKSDRKLISINIERSHDSIDFFIKDTGCGIPEHLRSHIFDPFFTTKETGKGTGIGLSLATTIINEHEGKISCDSTVGVGTTIKLTIPVCRESRACQEESPTSLDPAQTPTLKNLTILFVEDEEELREIAMFHLGQLGMKLETAANGAVALEALKHRNFDLIISDVTMPVMDGIQFFERFSATEAAGKTKFIFMTGGAVRRQERFLHVMDRVDGIMAKPFTQSAFIQQLQTLFGTTPNST
jgi:PAS domain S-box-containing protein